MRPRRAPGAAPQAGQTPISGEARVAGLDSLRGLAVLGVFLFHAAYVALLELGIDNMAVVLAARFGWIGADLFFVLSGYLITAGLLATKGRGGYLKAFWWRRLLRIVPAYYVFLVFIFFVWPLVAAGREVYFEQGHLELPSLSYWLFGANMFMALVGDHGYMPLSMTWSLAIEWHFYVVWPFVVLWSRPRTLVGLSLGLLGAVFLARIAALEGGAPELAVYVLTPTRLDALGAGALIAALRAGGGRCPGPAFLAGAFLISAALFVGGMLSGSTYVYGSPFLISLKYSLLALMFFCVVLATVSGGRVNRALTTVPFLDRLGKYSYAFYLWHFFVLLTAVQIIKSGPASFAGELGEGLVCAGLVLAGGAVAFAISALSWTVFEAPALRLKGRLPYG